MVSRIIETCGSIPICKTEAVNNNLNPVWRPVTLSTQQFGSKENPLIIESLDFNSSGNHALIGELQKSVADLEKLHKERAGVNFILTRHGHQKVLKSQLFIDRFVEKEQHSFLDYISGRFELNFMLAAIMEVGEVIQFYDADRRFLAWGFGGTTYDNTVSHCFNLNGNPNAYEVEGVEGIMAAYASVLHNVLLSGPTLFGQVIDNAAQIASRSTMHNSNKYFVLLIITDGVLIDLQETKDSFGEGI